MACNPCEEKKKRKQLESTQASSIKCYCGITRILPPGLEIGSTVTLPPCLKCGSPFSGKYLGTTVVEDLS